jgi:hypothetical protein
MELPSCPIVDGKSMIGLQLLAIIEQRCRETVPHLLAVVHWVAQSLCSSHTNILICKELKEVLAQMLYHKFKSSIIGLDIDRRSLSGRHRCPVRQLCRESLDAHVGESVD